MAMFLCVGRAEHEGHGHRLREYMKGYRGGGSKRDMASGGGIGHDHGATRASNVENFGGGDD